MRIFLIISLVLAFGSFVAGQNPAISLRDISAESGITVSHISSAENRYIIESMSGGAAIFDCDSDGLQDVATINGSSVDNFKTGGDLFLTLYRQVTLNSPESPKFENVTGAAGLSRKGWGMGITAVDFDNDGLIDLFATGFNGNAVYRAVGPCKFEDVTEISGLKGTGFQTGASWADYDRDGDLDVFVPGYVFLDLKNLPVFGSSQTCSFKGIRVQCGPRGLPGERDFLFRNKGNGVFEEVGVKSGVSDEKKFYGLQSVWFDYDNDGWLDLYVANDGTPNHLYKNNKNGSFTDVSFESGTSYNGSGVEQGSMGLAAGDYDNDGNIDLFVTNFDNEHNTLYRNLGSRGFLDVSTESQLSAPGLPYVGWGTGFVDFDNDGLFDLLVLNGHVYPQIEFAKSATQMGFRQPLLLHRNLGNGKFSEISKDAGLRDLPMFSSRGAAFGDLNNDGLVDVVITNLGEKPLVLLNTTNNGNQRVSFQLTTTETNRNAIGSRITLKTDRRKMVQEIYAGTSYLSQNDLRLHFGLGNGEKINSVEINWSDGSREALSTVEPDSFVMVQKGSGIKKTKKNPLNKKTFVVSYNKVR